MNKNTYTGMIREDKYIRFDWAMKRLLRNKANFAVLEGLLTTLLGEKITIRRRRFFDSALSELHSE